MLYYQGGEAGVVECVGVFPNIKSTDDELYEASVVTMTLYNCTIELLGDSMDGE